MADNDICTPQDFPELVGPDNDWGINGTHIYSLNTGNVGIGTQSPSEKLEVVGTVLMTGFKLTTGAGAGKLFKSDAVGVGSWSDVNLDDLADVTAPSPALNEVLTWNGSAWVNLPTGGLSISGTDNRIVRMDTASDIQDSGLVIDDSDNIYPNSGTPTLGIAGNRWGTLFLSSNIDYSTDLNFVSSSVTQLTIQNEAGFGTIQISGATIGTAQLSIKNRFSDGITEIVDLYNNKDFKFFTAVDKDNANYSTGIPVALYLGSDEDSSYANSVNIMGSMGWKVFTNTGNSVDLSTNEEDVLFLLTGSPPYPSANGVEVTLPDPAGRKGRVMFFKMANGLSSDTMSFVSPAVLVDGQAMPNTYSGASVWVAIFSDGVNYYVISQGNG